MGDGIRAGEYTILPGCSTSTNLFPFAQAPISHVWLLLWQAAEPDFCYTASDWQCNFEYIA